VSGWITFAAWCLGWLLAVRPSMRRTMLREVCSECGGDWLCDCDRSTGAYGVRNPKPPRVVAGSKFDRTGADVAWSLWIAVWWPVWLLTTCVKRGVIRATPLTGPELERRIAERDKEIERLTKQIGATPP
jgi:hypothetical protein